MELPLPTYKSIVAYTGDGVTTRWAINFDGGYIDPSHVRTKIGASDTAAVFDGPGTVVVTPAVASGTTFKIQRATPSSTSLADFADGAGITEQNLDILARQAIMVAAEAYDRTVEYTTAVSGGDFSAAVSAAAAEAAATAAAAAIVAVSGTIASTVASQIAAAVTGYLTAGSVATLTGKTVNLADNTLTGTPAQFNTALAGADFAFLTTAQTLAEKTLTAPVINGGTIDAADINGGTLDAAAVRGGTLEAGNTVNDTGAVSPASPGFRSVPFVAVTGTPTFLATHAGKGLSLNANATIPDNATLAYPDWSAIALYNRTASPITIGIAGTDTLRQLSTGTLGTRTIPAYSMALIIKVGATSWVIGGAGVT